MISLKGLTSGPDKKPQANAAAPAAKPAAPAAKGKNIFGKSMAPAKQTKSSAEAYVESKNKKKAIATLGASFVALAAYSVLFFYGHVTAYLEAPAQISELETSNEEFETVIIPSLEKTRDLHKSAYDQEFEEVISALDEVFPQEIDKLGIVRLFESFASEVDASFPPFEFTSINLSSPIQQDGYVVIPASTTIHSSLAGFDKFLSLVENSGLIYSGEGDLKKLLAKKIRLMSISNISVKYRGIDVQTGRDGGVDFSVKVDIYSRPSGQ